MISYSIPTAAAVEVVVVVEVEVEVMRSKIIIKMMIVALLFALIAAERVLMVLE